MPASSARRAGRRPAGRDLQWVVDPLDGTVNFLYALPVVAVSVAAAVDGAVVAGAVVDVVGAETWSAAVGHGARLDGDPIGVSTCPALDHALVTTGFSYRAEIRRRQGDVVGRLLPAARDIRCFGSAALQLCWVGAGRADAYFERDIKLWDYAAAALIAARSGRCDGAALSRERRLGARRVPRCLQRAARHPAEVRGGRRFQRFQIATSPSGSTPSAIRATASTAIQRSRSSSGSRSPIASR